jgi:hypothetical protein
VPTRKVDGKDSAAFLGTNRKAADSNRLGGKDSTEFLSSGDYYRKLNERLERMRAVVATP